MKPGIWATTSLMVLACAAAQPAESPAPAGFPTDAHQPGIHAAIPVPDTIRKGYTLADVRFMQGMIGHHVQALEMAALVETRTSQENMKLLAERITVSQKDEIALMRNWLQARGEAVPSTDAHAHAGMGHGELMPGMLTPQEMEAMANARGVEFDRLFLQGMIKHHEGAIVMVDQLFGSPGAGQEPELFVFASDVNADQSAEIKRMQMMLDRLNAR